MPNDMMYLPVQVGAEKKESLGYARDNEGENISKKNPNYCELTSGCRVPWIGSLSQTLYSKKAWKQMEQNFNANAVGVDVGNQGHYSSTEKKLFY